jgi:quercetin dioxygenase-like cupin family protein
VTSAPFSMEGAQEPTEPGRFIQLSDIRPTPFADGLEFQPVVGQNTMLNFVRFAPHAEAPLHVHAEEQLVIVLEGSLVFELDGKVRTLRIGDVAVVPPWVPHGAHTDAEACYEVDVFNPPRTSLLALTEAARA